MGGFRSDKQTAYATVGLGCFLTCVLSALFGKFPFSDFFIARMSQLPLTLSGDIGCLVGIAACVLTHRLNTQSETVRGFATAFVSAGLCLSYLARTGSIVGRDVAGAVVVLGDFFSGLFTMACAFIWWRLCAPCGERTAVKRLAGGLGFAGIAYLVLSIMPAEAARIVSCIIMPLAMCLCLLPLISAKAPTGSGGNKTIDSTRQIGEGVQRAADDSALSRGRDSSTTTDSESTRHPFPPRVILATAALSCFVIDLAMALFPVCLYHEESPLLALLFGGPASANAPIGTLTQPAAICALLTIVFATVLFAFAKRGTLPLAPLYYVGFAMTAFNYLAFPYHFSGGIPLAVGEAGRIVIALFIIILMMRLLDNRGGNASVLFLKVTAVAFAAMLVADIIAVTVQLQPGFDYADFRFRTVFAGIGTAVLVVLLLGPLPRVNAAIAPLPEPVPSPTDNDSPSNLTLEERLEQACASFATDHGLSARESEVLTLIANGRDVPYIERELVLAKSTVKTHIKHIYEKCGVSSRQDLLDMLEEYKG